MKKIVVLLIFLSAFSCSKSISQISSIKSLDESPQLNLPYGDRDLFHEFPADWDYSRWNHSKENLVQDSLLNKLDFFLFEDIANPIRKTFTADYIKVKPLLAKEFAPSKAIKSNKEKMEIKGAKVFSSKDFAVFSIAYKGKIDCKTCEYPENQTHNVLISIKDGKVIDKLLISYFNGSDLSQSTRYFYIDQHLIIHLKDFVSDEIGVAFLQYLKYKINSEGKFIKQ